MASIFDAQAPSLKKVSAELMRKSFPTFARRAWAHFDPAPLVWNWHLEGMCRGLQYVAEGKIRNLLINIPPGHAKSAIVSVLWPAWRWAVDPSWQVICGSYEVGLATRDAVRARELMLTEWYQSHFQTVDDPAREWVFLKDQNVKTYYVNSKGGHRASVGVGGRGTGYRCRTLIVDDPLKAADGHSQLARREAILWLTETMASRFNDPATAERVIIMQRLHEEDLSGHVLKVGGWEHLVLPSEFNPKRAAVLRDSSGKVLWKDPRTVAGELLFPQRYTAAHLAELKSPKGMGSYAYSAQHDQDPIPAAGGILKRAWFGNRWLRPGQARVDGFNCKELPIEALDTWEIVTDAAFKKTDTSDRVAIGVFARAGQDIYLIDLSWDRRSFTETVNEIIRLRNKWSKVRTVAVEEAANGAAIIEVLKQVMPGVVPIKPEGGKESRIFAAARYYEGANVWLPIGPEWVEPLVDEACAFPLGAHDDGIDMLSYAANRMLTNSDLAYLEQLVAAGAMNWVHRVN